VGSVWKKKMREGANSNQISVVVIERRKTNQNKN